jgi:endonuclease/exonuclease/phosphatase (EEP) superfamily protein YafD
MWARRGFGALAALLLLAAVSFTLLRLLQPTFGPSMMLTALAPYAVILYAAGVAALFAATRARAVWAVAVVSVGAIALHAWWAQPAFSGSPAAPDPDSFTVMTANVRLGQAAEEPLVRTVIAEDVDVLVLQELSVFQLASLDRAGLSQVLPYRAGGSGAEWGLTMTLSRYPVQQGAIWDSGSSHEVTIESPKGVVTLLAVHPDRPRATGAHDWLKDQDQLLERAEALRGPALIAGDLNASEDHLALRRLESAGYRDSGELIGAGWQPTWPSIKLLGIPLPVLVQLDHVMVNDEIEVVGSSTRSITGSDHRAVIAEVVVAGR